MTRTKKTICRSFIIKFMIYKLSIIIKFVCALRLGLLAAQSQTIWNIWIWPIYVFNLDISTIVIIIRIFFLRLSVCGLQKAAASLLLSNETPHFIAFGNESAQKTRNANLINILSIRQFYGQQQCSKALEFGANVFNPFFSVYCSLFLFRLRFSIDAIITFWNSIFFFILQIFVCVKVEMNFFEMWRHFATRAYFIKYFPPGNRQQSARKKKWAIWDEYLLLLYYHHHMTQPARHAIIGSFFSNIWLLWEINLSFS